MRIRRHESLRVGPFALFCCFGWLWLAGPATAESAPAVAHGRCAIEFFATSTLHDFSGEVDASPFDLERHEDGPTDASTGQEWWSGSVEVAVADMSTGVDRRDRNMRSMFDADRFPRIVADFRRVESAAFAGARGGEPAALDFSLTIRAVTHPLEARVSHWVESASSSSFDAEFEVSLESFGLSVPPVLGLLRVEDLVRVRAHVTLERPDANRAAIGPRPPPNS